MTFFGNLISEFTIHKAAAEIKIGDQMAVALMNGEGAQIPQGQRQFFRLFHHIENAVGAGDMIAVMLPCLVFEIQAIHIGGYGVSEEGTEIGTAL